jgi:uncharacterized cupin superfamily protein
VPNLFSPEWDASADRDPYRWRRSFIGKQAGSEQLGASLFDVPAGSSTFPLHAHHANEELIVVLEGTLVLRTIEDERELHPGDVFACLAGRRGAHRLDNRGDQPARVLIVSTMRAPEVNEYPDSDLVWARSWAPGNLGGDGDVEVSGDGTPLDPLSLP